METTTSRSTAIARVMTTDGQWLLSAIPQSDQPANAWDVWLRESKNHERLRVIRVGGLWRESWQYYGTVARGICRHPAVGSIYHQLPGSYTTLYLALNALAHDLSRYTSPRIWTPVPASTQ